MIRPLYVGTYWIGGWVDSRAGLDTVMKRKNPKPCRTEIEPPVVQHVPTHCIELNEL
jgi:hypothetical protein